MMKFPPILIGLLIAACAGTITPPEVPPTDFSSPPALTDKGYAITVVVRDFPMIRRDFRAWIADDNKVVQMLEPYESIAKPVDAVYFDGNWPDPGATRRVELSDGHFLLERVLSNTPGAFEYQVWGLTSAAGRNVEHIHGIQAFEPLSGSETRMTWTYKVKPDAGFKRPFVQRFVNREVTPFLEGGLGRLKVRAEAEVDISESGR